MSCRILATRRTSARAPRPARPSRWVRNTTRFPGGAGWWPSTCGRGSFAFPEELYARLRRVQPELERVAQALDVKSQALQKRVAPRVAAILGKPSDDRRGAGAGSRRFTRRGGTPLPALVADERVLGASVKGRVALGSRAGAWVRRLGDARNGGRDLARAAAGDLDGFDHANVWCRRTIGRGGAFCRYVLRPPFAQERLRRGATGASRWSSSGRGTTGRASWSSSRWNSWSVWRR